jgi:hypothetical protein
MESLAIVEAFGRSWGTHDLGVTLALLIVDCVFESTASAPDGALHGGRDLGMT